LPVPHFNIKITQRSKGNSAVAGAAYQAGEKLFSEYDQKTKNYTCKKEVVYGDRFPIHAALPSMADSEGGNAYHRPTTSHRQQAQI